MAVRDGCFVNDMTEYVKGMKGRVMQKGKTDEKLDADGLKMFRHLVAGLRWPAHLVLRADLRSAHALRDKLAQGAEK